MSLETCVIKLNTGEELVTKTDLTVENPILSQPLKLMVTGVNKQTGQAMVDFVPYLMACPESDNVEVKGNAIITVVHEEHLSKQMLDEYLQRTTKIQLN